MKTKWYLLISTCVPLCLYIQTIGSIFWYTISHIRFTFHCSETAEQCVCEGDREIEKHLSTVIRADRNWEFIIETGKFLPETFWLRTPRKKKCMKNSKTTTLRTKLSNFGAKVQRLGSPEVYNCSLKQKPPCIGPEEEWLHLSSLNLLAPISFFFPLGLLLKCEECSFICFQCGLTRNSGCREVARQQNMKYCWWKHAVRLSRRWRREAAGGCEVES